MGWGMEAVMVKGGKENEKEDGRMGCGQTCSLGAGEKKRVGRENV